MKLPTYITWQRIVIVIALYLLFIIATFPASFAIDRLQSNGVNLGNVSGSIWNGRTTMLQTSGLSLGPTQWHIKPWSLLIGRLSVTINAKRDDGYVDATISRHLGGKVVISDLRASLPIAAFSGNSIANNWQGTVQTQISQLTLVNNWPALIIGSVEAHDLNGPAREPAAIGSYRITFDEKDNKGADGLLGHVTSLQDSPLDVDGKLTILANRQYSVDAQVATRANAPASINQALQYLGLPDAQGKRSLSLAGSL